MPCTSYYLSAHLPCPLSNNILVLHKEWDKIYMSSLLRKREKIFYASKIKGTAVAQWLRCYATNWKVAGSIPAGVIGIFRLHKILLIALWPWGQLSL